VPHANSECDREPHRRAWQPRPNVCLFRIEIGGRKVECRSQPPGQSHRASFANQNTTASNRSKPIRVLVTRWASILPSSSLERASMNELAANGNLAQPAIEHLLSETVGIGRLGPAQFNCCGQAFTDPSSPRMIQTIAESIVGISTFFLAQPPRREHPSRWPVRRDGGLTEGSLGKRPIEKQCLGQFPAPRATNRRPRDTNGKRPSKRPCDRRPSGSSKRRHNQSPAPLPINGRKFGGIKGGQIGSGTLDNNVLRRNCETELTGPRGADPLHLVPPEP